MYVKLSRATRREGLHLFQAPERLESIEPGIPLDDDIKQAVARLARRGEETVERFRRVHGQKSWFPAWESIEEFIALKYVSGGIPWTEQYS